MLSNVSEYKWGCHNSSFELSDLPLFSYFTKKYSSCNYKTINNGKRKISLYYLSSGIRPAAVEPDDDSDGDEAQVELKTFTLKQLIRQLHISKPVDHVMSLIGKKYPTTRDEFYKLNLPGKCGLGALN